MGFDTDPIGNGLVAGLARPGGNITGLSVLSPELGGKRLELLTEIVPKLARVAVLGSSTLPGNTNVQGDGTRRWSIGRKASAF
jgi:putative ABC transport system substrate-binding protein